MPCVDLKRNSGRWAAVAIPFPHKSYGNRRSPASVVCSSCRNWRPLLTYTSKDRMPQCLSDYKYVFLRRRARSKQRRFMAAFSALSQYSLGILAKTIPGPCCCGGKPRTGGYPVSAGVKCIDDIHPAACGRRCAQVEHSDWLCGS